MKIGEFIESVFHSLQASGLKPSIVRFQLNIDHHEFGSGIEVVNARIAADDVAFPVPGVPESKEHSFGIEFAIPCGPWPD